MVLGLITRGLTYSDPRKTVLMGKLLQVIARANIRCLDGVPGLPLQSAKAASLHNVCCNTGGMQRPSFCQKSQRLCALAAPQSRRLCLSLLSGPLCPPSIFFVFTGEDSLLEVQWGCFANSRKGRIRLRTRMRKV